MNRAERRRQQGLERRARKRAAKSAPGAMRQALGHHQAGRLAEARRIYARILAAEPEHAEALHLLGVLNSQSGEQEAAAGMIARAIELRPDYAEAHHNLGNVLYQQDKADDAIASFRRAVAIDPGYAEAHYNLGAVLRARGRLDEAVASLGRAAEISPDDALTQLELGAALAELGRTDEAVACYRRALEIDPDDAEARGRLGALLREARRIDEAAECLREAARRRPEDAKAEADIGHLLLERGHPEEAVAHYRRALVLDPTDAEAHRQLARASAGSRRADEVAAMERLFEAGELEADDAIALGFALAEVYEEAGETGRAFEALARANALKRAGFDYDIAGDETVAEAIIAACDADTMAAPDGGACDSETPIFVFGMPRSGSSLVEQILSTHPQVFGAGEVNLLRPALFDGFSPETGETLAAFLAAQDGARLARRAGAYLARLSALAPAARRITDKYLNNFWYAGPIALMLPRATLVHCRRDPLDTCFSCYANLFRGEVRFAYDLAELGRYHRIHDRLMAHWRALLGPRLVEIRYEALIGEPEAEMRRLVAACGLDWDPACLRFFETERYVGTASAAQVRRPLFSGSIGRGHRFEAHLGPLIEALDASRS